MRVQIDQAVSFIFDGGGSELLCRSLKVSNEIVREARFATNHSDERVQFHVSFDRAEVVMVYVANTKSIAYNYKNLVFPRGAIVDKSI